TGLYFRGRVRPLQLLSLMMVIALLLPIVNIARNKQGEGLGEMASFVRDNAETADFNPGNGDATGPYITLVDTTDTLRVPEELRYGQTYTMMLTLLPPRFLYPNRPTPLDEEFAKIHLGKDYYDNAGYAYSSVTEAYLNFGYVGAFFVFLLVGLG